jgi:hypothetical protein
MKEIIKNLKSIVIVGIFLATSVSTVFAQFVDVPEVRETESSPAIKSQLQLTTIFDVLIIIAALIFVVSIFGFIIGFIKVVTAGGDEMTTEEGSNLLVLSGWIFGAAVLIFLLVNIIKYFIY